MRRMKKTKIFTCILNLRHSLSSDIVIASTDTTSEHWAWWKQRNIIKQKGQIKMFLFPLTSLSLNG